MIKIKKFDDVKKLRFRNFGPEALADILLSAFLMDNELKMVPSIILILKEDEHFERPHLEPLVQTCVGCCRKEIFDNPEVEERIVIYTIVDVKKNFDIERMVDWVIGCAKAHNEKYSVVDIQREFCTSFPEAIEIYERIKPMNLTK